MLAPYPRFDLGRIKNRSSLLSGALQVRLRDTAAREIDG
jgi:hypothetical protein